jgi:hypothetical protein
MMEVFWYWDLNRVMFDTPVLDWRTGEVIIDAQELVEPGDFRLRDRLAAVIEDKPFEEDEWAMEYFQDAVHAYRCVRSPIHDRTAEALFTQRLTFRANDNLSRCASALWLLNKANDDIYRNVTGLRGKHQLCQFTTKRTQIMANRILARYGYSAVDFIAETARRLGGLPQANHITKHLPVLAHQEAHHLLEKEKLSRKETQRDA